MLDGDPAAPPPKGHSSQLSDHICCGQIAGWLETQLGREVGLGQASSDIVSDGDPAPPPPKKRSMSIVAKRLDGSRWHMEWR